MPTRTLPNTNRGRMNAIQRAKDRKDHSSPSKWPFRSATVTELDNFTPIYAEKYKALTTTKQKQTSDTEKVKKTKRMAIRYLKSFVIALNGAIYREEFSPSDRAYYDVPSNGNMPIIRSEQDIMSYGEKISDGEAKRVANGGALITFPSIAQVNTAVNEFKTFNNSQSINKINYDEALEDIQRINKTADKLIRKIWNEINAAYDEGDKASTRAKAREWGVVYTSRKKIKRKTNLSSRNLYGKSH